MKYKDDAYNIEYIITQAPWPFDTLALVAAVMMTARTNVIMAENRNSMPRVRANSLPTELFFSQCGHLASWLISELNRNSSPQWPQFTLQRPGTGEMSVFVGLFLGVGVYKTISLWHDGRGHEILCAVDLQISKQLQGHLMYFWPGGGSRMG